MDIEKKVASSLSSPGTLEVLYREGVRSIHFLNPLYQSVYEFVVGYWEESSRSKVPSWEVLTQKFPSFEPEEVDETPLFLSRELIQSYTWAQVSEMLLSVARERQKKSDVREQLSNMLSRTSELLEVSHPRVGRVEFTSSTPERDQRYVERAMEDPTVRGVSWGFEQVDEVTGGLRPGELGIVAGFAKTGKSHFLCHLASSLWKKGLTPVLFTLELSTEDMEDRLECHVSGVSYERYSRGALMPEELEQLEKSREENRDRSPLYVEKPGIEERTVSSLMGRARELRADVVLIDQLSFITPSQYLRERRDQITNIITDLKLSASSQENDMLPVVLASQLNRASRESRKGPEMEHLALSSSIEQTADIILGLSQTTEMRLGKSMMLDILGSRRSPLSSWVLEWELSRATRIQVRSSYVRR